MPPKKSAVHSRNDVGSSHNALSSDTGTALRHQEHSYLQQYPNIRRFFALAIFIIVVGVPCPPQFFYSTFIAHSTWLRVFHRLGIFSDAVFMCEQAVGPLYTHDHEYYERFQKHSNLTDEAMFGYLQQWMCVMPPNNYDEFISDTLQRYSDFMQGSDMFDDLDLRGGLDNLDLDAILQQHGVAGQDYLNDRIINSVYQEVESEPLML
mmetsp:Transcript_11299/g.18396  ORF Transcript_11299/g.18396 Transcript_11299/m.18396 type:complete len:207 (-) Transcript_11299:88-708(-)